MSKYNSIIKDVSNYYSEKLMQFGPTFQGVDWRSKESQEIRFDQILKIIELSDESFSILDYGCGYGALFPYMKNKFKKFKYFGFDTSDSMIQNAIAQNPYDDGRWLIDSNNLSKTDYVVASGLFNVKQKYFDNVWKNYVIDMLESINKLAIKGFSFNLLTMYSDKDQMEKKLFYADPLYFFDYCKLNFSRNVALLHDYSLHEFTILVRKSI